MSRRIGLAVLALLLWGAATFGLAALAAEWRQESVDIAPLATQVSRLVSDVDEIRTVLQATPTPTPIAPTPSATPTPTPQPQPVPLTPGRQAESGGALITVEKVASGRVDFTLEGPYPGALGVTFKVVDEDGFVCEAGINAESYDTLGEGEKTRFWILYTCQPGAQPATLSLDGVTFEFP